MFKISQSRSQITKIWVSPKSQKFQNCFADHTSPIFEAANSFSRYLAPLGAKYLGKWPNKILKIWVSPPLSLVNGLKTRFEKKHIFHPSLQAPALARLVTLVNRLNFQAVIPPRRLGSCMGAPQSRRPSAEAVVLALDPKQLPSRRGGCASSRLDHGLKV